jgi:hypothetical protein
MRFTEDKKNKAGNKNRQSYQNVSHSFPLCNELVEKSMFKGRLEIYFILTLKLRSEI